MRILLHILMAIVLWLPSLQAGDSQFGPSSPTISTTQEHRVTERDLPQDHVVLFLQEKIIRSMLIGLTEAEVTRRNDTSYSNDEGRILSQRFIRIISEILSKRGVDGTQLVEREFEDFFRIEIQPFLVEKFLTDSNHLPFTHQSSSGAPSINWTNKDSEFVMRNFATTQLIFWQNEIDRIHTHHMEENTGCTFIEGMHKNPLVRAKGHRFFELLHSIIHRFKSYYRVLALGGNLAEAARPPQDSNMLVTLERMCFSFHRKIKADLAYKLMEAAFPIPGEKSAADEITQKTTNQFLLGDLMVLFSLEGLAGEITAQTTFAQYFVMDIQPAIVKEFSSSNHPSIPLKMSFGTVKWDPEEDANYILNHFGQRSLKDWEKKLVNFIGKKFVPMDYSAPAIS